VLQIHCHPCHLHGNLTDLVVDEQVTGRHSEHTAVDRQSAVRCSPIISFNANGEWLVGVVWLPKARYLLAARFDFVERVVAPQLGRGLHLLDQIKRVKCRGGFEFTVGQDIRCLKGIVLDPVCLDPLKAKGVSGEVDDVFNPQPFDVV
jgi:hypothetical protein